ncbi:MAG: diguanylate cyclase, partial [Candidatus Obscuribacterales bacterium]|nr:diguanylate cyclase [Candidatus Obscuribacterales bacterium]
MNLSEFSPIFETLSEGLILVDPELKLLRANKAAEQILGPALEGLIKLPTRSSTPSAQILKNLKQTISAVKPQYLLQGDLMPLGSYKSDGKAMFRADDLPLHRALLGESISEVEMLVRNQFKPEGIRLKVKANPVKDESGKVIAAVCAFTDISQAHMSEQRQNIFRQVFAQTQEAIVITDASYMVQYANQAYWDLTGDEPEKILNSKFNPKQEEAQEANSWEEMKAAVGKEGRWSGEFVIRKRSKELLPLWATLHAVVDSSSTVTNYVLTLSDLTNLKSSQEELYRLVTKDAVTGLSNRREFFQELEQMIERATRLEERFGVIFLDLQRFKELNDSLGHEAGDRLLQEIGRRLEKIQNQDDTNARLGGDEFDL